MFHKNKLHKNKQETGSLGENLAVKHLVKHGYRVLARNFRKPWGEIDIIALKANVLTFIEVKTLTTNNIFKPEDHFTFHKTKRLLRTCRLCAESLRQNIPWQIDLIAIELNPDGSVNEIRHIKGIETEK